MAETKTISLTIPEDLLRRLDRLANIDMRSRSGYIAKIVKEHIEGNEKENN